MLGVCLSQLVESVIVLRFRRGKNSDTPETEQTVGMIQARIKDEFEDKGSERMKFNFHSDARRLAGIIDELSLR